MAQRPEDMSLWARLLTGGFAAAMGLMIMAMAAGVIPVDPSSVHAPPWVIHVAGGMFTLVGLWMVTAGNPVGRALDQVVGPVVLMGLLSILHWVAFGPGVRQCSGGFSIPFLSAWRVTGDLGCRMAFGYGALLFDGLLLGAFLGSWTDAHLEGGWKRVGSGLSATLIVVPLSPFLLILIAAGLARGAWEKLTGGGTD